MREKYKIDEGYSEKGGRESSSVEISRKFAGG